MYAPFDRGEKEVLEFAFLSANMGKPTETKTENSLLLLKGGEKKKFWEAHPFRAGWNFSQEVTKTYKARG